MVNLEEKTTITVYDLKIISQLNKNSKTSLIFFLETLFLKELALMPWTLKYAKKIVFNFDHAQKGC